MNTGKSKSRRPVLPPLNATEVRCKEVLAELVEESGGWTPSNLALAKAMGVHPSCASRTRQRLIDKGHVIERIEVVA